jgi:short-subunit dehydrogenase
MASFVDRYGPRALITGAAQGIGAAFARQCAERGLSLVLVDVLEAPLLALAGRLRADHGVEVVPVVLDLTREGFLDRLREVTDGIEIGLFVANAGRATVGRFFATEVDDLRSVLRLNCDAVLQLVHHYGGRMRERRRGGMILLSSMSALQGTSMVAHYAATKAYSLVLAEGLGYELRDAGVDVLALLPGATRTPGFDGTGAEMAASMVMSAEDTAREALDALGVRPVCVPGRVNRAAAFFLGRVAPRARAVRWMGEAMDKIYRRRR